ncbi:hypothetical protein FYJ38_00085 [Clostridium sp. WB02_MRS01]|uniref:hypothetical protein n=1 Tax=Clostridium sp. WB02_MRS01 TaxID=2605777 RepID=UPI0012B3CE1F|nr:hypothetical protein [Clostridium sp. WB02_MRS01]MSS07036.1 hypothetical protein [Clostridium sp. WB02_MRS01]
MADDLKPVKITWKADEKWLHDYVWEHSSPSAWLKDLAIEDYKRKNAEEQPKQQNQGLLNFLD